MALKIVGFRYQRVVLVDFPVSFKTNKSLFHQHPYYRRDGCVRGFWIEKTICDIF